ncbi:3-hydroxylacyl-ACP dehydratase [Hydrogenophaga aquatica]
MLNHDWIASRIPHQGNMCLLSKVLEWSPEHVVCEATSHTAADHPLRANGQLSTVHGIEYAAQAMAVHGALLAGSSERPRAGYLASVRGVNMPVPRLDTCNGPLRVTAQRLSGDALRVLYGFDIFHEQRLLLQGRAAVVLDADALEPKP